MRKKLTIILLSISALILTLVLVIKVLDYISVTMEPHNEIEYSQLQDEEKQFVDSINEEGIYLFQVKDEKDKYLLCTKKKLLYNYYKVNIKEENGLQKVFIVTNDALDEGQAKTKQYFYLNSELHESKFKFFLDNEEISVLKK